jgi:hypothetical protein
MAIMNQKVILTIVIIILLATGGVMYFATTQKEQISQESIKEPSISSEDSEIMLVDETRIDDIISDVEDMDAKETNFTDWKTYRNEEYGFEFQHPSKWQFKTLILPDGEETEFWIVLNEDSPGSLETYYHPWKDLAWSTKGFQIIVTKPFDEKRYFGKSRNICGECVFRFFREPIQFAGTKASKTTAQFVGGTPEFYESLNMDGNKIQPYTYIVLNYREKGWVLSYSHSDLKGNYDYFFDQILSTFKFID